MALSGLELNKSNIDYIPLQFIDVTNEGTGSLTVKFKSYISAMSDTISPS